MVTLQRPVGNGSDNQTTDVRLVQQLLNRFRPAGVRLLRVDGGITPDVVSAIEDFQQRVAGFANPDGVVDPGGRTFTALCGGRTDVFQIAWGAKVSAAFKEKTVALCDRLSVPVDFLMSAMAFESGESFSPSVKNAAGSGAVGLIQFMPSTAVGLGTTSDKLAAMSAEDQLDFVEEYFAPKKGRLESLEDVYMNILLPSAIGHAPTFVLFPAGTKAFDLNKGLDINHDGTITVEEAASKVRAKFEKGIQPGFLA
jgi:hypothetical protein